MTTKEITAMISAQAEKAMESTASAESIEGFTLTATFKKAPALEIKTSFSFKKGADIREE